MTPDSFRFPTARHRTHGRVVPCFNRHVRREALAGASSRGPSFEDGEGGRRPIRAGLWDTRSTPADLVPFLAGLVLAAARAGAVWMLVRRSQAAPPIAPPPAVELAPPLADALAR